MNPRDGTAGPLHLRQIWLALHALIIVVGFAAIAGTPLAVRSQPLVGSRSSTTVRAASQVFFVDASATDRERRLVAAAVPLVFDSTVRSAIASRRQAGQMLAGIVQALQVQGESLPRKQGTVNELLVANSALLANLPQLDLRQWRVARRSALGLLYNSIYELRPFGESDVQSTVLHLDASLPRLRAGTRAVITDIVKTFITPTEKVNGAATARLRRQAAANVRPVVAPIPQGTIVVRKGQIITPGILRELRALGLPQGTAGWRQRIGTVVFGAVVVLLMLWYLYAFYPEVTRNQLLMFALDASMLITLLVARLAIPGHHFVPYFLPVAGAAALAGLLVSSEVGVTLAVVLALLVGWLVGSSFELTAFYLLTGVAGGMSVRQLRRLNDFLVAGFCVAATAVAVIAAFMALDGTVSLVDVRNFGVAAGFNGLISGALAFGGYVILGNAFGVTTALHLLELGHPDQKLLRRLMADAPGTYNHSLVVASMAERAAREIEGDVLLSRVMALYHDIGKVANPLCFIENQMGTTNIHDHLRPLESAEIVRAHVTHGIALAKQHRLPRPIQDAILQHHGTMTMAYFFHRALQEDPGVDAAMFTYPGPRPRTKEAALLMLADGCESAVRASAQKSPETIRCAVDRIVDDRVAADQLSQCNLTLRDLAAVRTAFVEVLNSIYHPRIEYPTLEGYPTPGGSPPRSRGGGRCPDVTGGRRQGHGAGGRGARDL
jgi:cyclic-di-AMP phosphodiesterase PgpH